MKVFEMSFLIREIGLSLRDSVRSLDIWVGLGVESLLLYIERSQLRWFGYLIRVPPKHLPGEGLSGMSKWEEALGQT